MKLFLGSSGEIEISLEIALVLSKLRVMVTLSFTVTANKRGESFIRRVYFCCFVTLGCIHYNLISTRHNIIAKLNKTKIWAKLEFASIANFIKRTLYITANVSELRN